MSTQELIQTELTRWDEAGLQALYPVIRNFVKARRPTEPPVAEHSDPLLTRLSQIGIDGPEDLATHHDGTRRRRFCRIVNPFPLGQQLFEGDFGFSASQARVLQHRTQTVLAHPEQPLRFGPVGRSTLLKHRDQLVQLRWRALHEIFHSRLVVRTFSKIKKNVDDNSLEALPPMTPWHHWSSSDCSCSCVLVRWRRVPDRPA